MVSGRLVQINSIRSFAEKRQSPVIAGDEKSGIGPAYLHLSFALNIDEYFIGPAQRACQVQMDMQHAIAAICRRIDHVLALSQGSISGCA